MAQNAPAPHLNTLQILPLAKVDTGIRSQGRKDTEPKALPFKNILAFVFVSSAKETEMTTTLDSVKGIGVDPSHSPQKNKSSPQ